MQWRVDGRLRTELVPRIRHGYHDIFKYERRSQNVDAHTPYELLLTGSSHTGAKAIWRLENEYSEEHYVNGLYSFRFKEELGGAKN